MLKTIFIFANLTLSASSPASERSAADVRLRAPATPNGVELPSKTQSIGTKIKVS